jgi:hypothetical protein
MVRRAVVGLVVSASMVVVGLAVPARAQDAAQTKEVAQTQAAKQVPDLTGNWRFEPKRSDAMQPGGGGAEGRGPRGGMGGERGGPRGGFGGGRGRPGGGMGGPGRGPGGPGGPGGDAEQGPPSDVAGRRPVRLPDLMHVTQTGTVVSFEDSSGAVLQEITTLGGAKDTLVHAPKAQVLSGQWEGKKLVVERTSPRAGKITETITLEDEGSLLVIRTKLAGSGDMPSREFKRVYKRVSD